MAIIFQKLLSYVEDIKVRNHSSGVQDTPARRSEIGERVPKGSYQILGINGPTLLVIPEYNVVVAKMYNKRYNYGGANYLHYLKEFSNVVADTWREQG